MKRRALVIFCDDTKSGSLVGPPRDNENIVEFLKSDLGGNWHGLEIESLNNPTKAELFTAKRNHLAGADYTFIVFTGHGFIEVDGRSRRQYVELADCELMLLDLKSQAERQTLIVDACRSFEPPLAGDMIKLAELSEALEVRKSTRDIFDQRVMAAEGGWSILYAADENQSAADSVDGAPYLLSLLNAAKDWAEVDFEEACLPLNLAHKQAASYLRANFETIQRPVMKPDKRRRYFPFAVKHPFSEILDAGLTK